MNTTKNSNLASMRERLSGVSEGEITIVLGESAAENLKTSLRHAEVLSASKRFDSVVYVNLPFSRKRFTVAAREQIGTASDTLDVHHFIGGKLVSSIGRLQDRFRNPERTAIIINSWEMSSSCYQYREALIFKLHELAISLGVTVIVYAMNKPDSVKAGYLNRTGLGKLAMAAEAVIAFEEEEEVEIIEEIDGTDASGGTDEMEMNEVAVIPEKTITLSPTKNAIENLVSSNSNNLATPNGHLNQKERRRMRRVVELGRV